MNTTLAGTAFPNDNGTSRQENLETISVGNLIMLQLEDDNLQDKNAIMVVNTGGAQVGYIPRKFVVELRRRLEFPYFAKVIDLIGSEGSRNVVIYITFPEGK